MTTTELAVPEQEDIQPSELMGIEEARKITARILQGTIVINDLIAEAYQRRAWAAMGYDDWDSYVDAEYHGAPLSLPREKRQEAVLSLRKKGLSLRAIASTTGTSPQTVANDLAAAEEAEVVEDDEPVSESTVQLLDTSQLTEEQHVRLDELSDKEANADDFLSDEEHSELQELREIIAVDAELVEAAPEPEKIVGVNGKEYKAKQEPKVPTVKVDPIVKEAKRVAKLISNAQAALNDLLTDSDYIDAPKATKALADEALAVSVVDLLEELDIRVPAKWSKLV